LIPEELRRVREAPETVPPPPQSNLRDGVLRREDVHALDPSRGAVWKIACHRVLNLAKVLTRNINPVGHTRLPRYARGRRGVVERDYGAFAFPDSFAAGVGQNAEHVYSIKFEGRPVRLRRETDELLAHPI
jgi:nitrile hydratase